MRASAQTLSPPGKAFPLRRGRADRVVRPYRVQGKKPDAQRQTRIRTTTKYRAEQERSFRETGRTSLSFKTLLVYTLGLRMQYRGVYKEECSMKKVCASLFLIILLLAAIVPVSAAGTLR